MHSSETQTPPAEQTPYGEYVEIAAEYAVDGISAVGEMEPKPYHDADIETFREDVRERMEEVRARLSVDEADPDTADVADATSVNWAALWDEFGFGEADACGNIWATPTQLKAALQCTEQAVPGDVKGQISDAVEDGTLNELTTSDQHGSIVTRGYVFTAGESA